MSKRDEYVEKMKAQLDGLNEKMDTLEAKAAYFSPLWTAFQAERRRDFSVIVDGISN